MNAGGLGSAIAAGMTGVQQGESRAIARERAQKQNQLLETQMQQAQYQQSLQKSPEQIAEENKVLMQQTKALNEKLSRQETYGAFQKFNIDGNTGHLNRLLKNPSVNQSFSSQIPQFTNITAVSDINLASDEDQALLRKHNLDPEVVKQLQDTRSQMKNMTPEQIKAAGLDPDHEGFNRFVKVQGMDEAGQPSYELVDMYEVFAKTGYLSSLDSQALDMQLKRASITKVKTGGKGETKFSYTKEQYEAAVPADKRAEYSMLEWIDDQKRATQAKGIKASKEQEAETGTPITPQYDEAGAVIEASPFEKEMAQGSLEFKEGLSETVTLTGNKKEAEQRYQRAKTLQGKEAPTTETTNYLTKRSSMVSSFKILQDKLSTLKMDKNAFTRVKNAVAKFAGAGATGTISADDLAKFKNELSFNAELKVVMAQFVKDMSGAAVTEQERAMYSNIIEGGAWSTKEAMVASISGFTEGLTSHYENTLDGIKTEYPRTFIEQRRNYLRNQQKYEKVTGVKQTRKEPSHIQETKAESAKVETFESYASELQKMGVTPHNITKEQRDKLQSLKGVK